jgi:mannose-6-phosphate isomerase-like protein (cupin superfamily)
MKGYNANIEKLTLENNNFRQVLYTGKYCQLVIMSLKPGEDIGSEVHPETDQFFRIESGQGKAIIDGNEYEISDGSVVIVPAGSQHNIVNLSSEKPLKLYTIYAPPHHRDGVIHPSKEVALTDEEHFDGKTSE